MADKPPYGAGWVADPEAANHIEVVDGIWKRAADLEQLGRRLEAAETVLEAGYLGLARDSDRGSDANEPNMDLALAEECIEWAEVLAAEPDESASAALRRQVPCLVLASRAVLALARGDHPRVFPRALGALEPLQGDYMEPPRGQHLLALVATVVRSAGLREGVLDVDQADTLRRAVDAIFWPPGSDHLRADVELGFARVIVDHDPERAETLAREVLRWLDSRPRLADGDDYQRRGEAWDVLARAHERLGRDDAAAEAASLARSARHAQPSGSQATHT